MDPESLDDLPINRFYRSGDYTVSFRVAYGSFSNESIKVTLDGVELQTVKPSSNKNFSQVTAAFSTTSGKHTLRFAGIGPISTGEQAVVFIDEVAIKGPLPQISDGPKDLDPTSKITLKGSHFGNDKGKFRIHFPSASLVHFANTSSKDNLDLDVDGKWTDDGTIESEKIVTASPVGSVSEQTVDITVIAANGQTSNVWHAKISQRRRDHQRTKNHLAFPQSIAEGMGLRGGSRQTHRPVSQTVIRGIHRADPAFQV
jgi:hypothetical protein